tara:strand:- start:251 stop:487 length:237 start_codon:yes stop_codon:yes gene_type:complete
MFLKYNKEVNVSLNISKQIQNEIGDLLEKHGVEVQQIIDIFKKEKSKPFFCFALVCIGLTMEKKEAERIYNILSAIHE